jgi:hypothetical protein
MIARDTDADRLWQLTSDDSTFNGMERLYEPRPWALEELTREKFVEHVRLGEVAHLARAGSTGEEAVLILVADVPPAEDEEMRFAAIAGAPLAAFELVTRARDLSGAALRFRIPDDASLADEVRQLYRDGGFEFPEFVLHILARLIDAAHAVPEADPAAVILEDAPLAVIRPPR